MLENYSQVVPPIDRGGLTAGLFAFQLAEGVGSITNSFVNDHKNRHKRNDTVQSIVEDTVSKALNRIKGDCAKYLSSQFRQDPKTILQTLLKRKEITYNEAKVGGAIASSTDGLGINGHIYLGDRFFRDALGNESNPGARVTSAQLSRVRQLVILHELRHIVTGIRHPLDANGNAVPGVQDSNEDFNRQIEKKCGFSK